MRLESVIYNLVDRTGNVTVYFDNPNDLVGKAKAWQVRITHEINGSADEEWIGCFSEDTHKPCVTSARSLFRDREKIMTRVVHEGVPNVG